MHEARHHPFHGPFHGPLEGQVRLRFPLNAFQRACRARRGVERPLCALHVHDHSEVKHRGSILQCCLHKDILLSRRRCVVYTLFRDYHQLADCWANFETFSDVTIRRPSNRGDHGTILGKSLDALSCDTKELT